ncbi:MAG: cobalt-precorrin 5A hydrolase [Methanomicrobiales archaeon]
MNVAILVVNLPGYKLALTISEKLKNDPTIFKVDIFQKKVKNTLKKIFNDYDIIIGIMASGIMVRSLCGLIKNKYTDPGILIIDDNSKNVISLLSGHLGGANQFSKKISKLLGSECIITTSTDVNNKIGIDEIARHHFFEINDFKNIKTINTALVANNIVKLYVPEQFGYLKENSIIKNSYEISIDDETTVITACVDSESLILKPKEMVLGLGSKRGVSTYQVTNAVKKALKFLNLPIERIDKISTADIKKDELGIINFANKYDKPIEIISIDSLKNFKRVKLTKSSFVQEVLGVDGVCEPCALISAGDNSRLILRKLSVKGVTVSVAISE